MMVQSIYFPNWRRKINNPPPHCTNATLLMIIKYFVATRLASPQLDLAVENIFRHIISHDMYNFPNLVPNKGIPHINRRIYWENLSSLISMLKWIIYTVVRTLPLMQNSGQILTPWIHSRYDGMLRPRLAYSPLTARSHVHFHLRSLVMADLGVGRKCLQWDCNTWVKQHAHSKNEKKWSLRSRNGTWKQIIPHW